MKDWDQKVVILGILFLTFAWVRVYKVWCRVRRLVYFVWARGILNFCYFSQMMQENDWELPDCLRSWYISVLVGFMWRFVIPAKNFQYTFFFFFFNEVGLFFAEKLKLCTLLRLRDVGKFFFAHLLQLHRFPMFASSQVPSNNRILPSSPDETNSRLRVYTSDFTNTKNNWIM